MKRFAILLMSMPVYAGDGHQFIQNSTAYSHSFATAESNANVGNVSTGSVSVDDQAPAVSAPAVMTSAPCFVGISGGVSVAGFGASGGSGIEDKKCTVRETSRILYAQGEREASVRVMCVDGLAALALGQTKCAGMPVLLPVELPTCHDDEIVAKRLGVSQCRK